ncbi:hypothetical protein ACHAW6_014454 [Cyclotella cf. meneghiniana]
MAGNMEDILMGSGFDSDDSDDNNSKLVSPAPSVNRAAPLNPNANTTSLSSSAPPPNVAASSSKSALTNRLKNLYASPSNAAGPGGSGAPIAPGNLPRGGIPHLPSQPQPSARPPPGGYGHSMPPPAPQQQQHPPTGYDHTHHASSNAAHRMPAPLPKARTSNRSAPPANRMASVPPNTSAGMPPPSSQAQYPQQPHHPQQQPTSGSYQPSPSRPTASNYPPHHHPGANSGPPSRSSASRGIPQQQQPPQMQSQQSATLKTHASQQQMQSRSSVSMTKAHQAQLQQQQMKQQQMQQHQMQQQQQLQQQQQQQQQQHLMSSRPASSSQPTSLSSVLDANGSNMTDAEKKEKEKFLMFTRVLMKYLEQRDKALHQKAKEQIRECYEKNKAGDPMFQPLTQSMKVRLRSTVGEVYWNKALIYLDQFFKAKKLKPKERDGQQPPDRLSSGGVDPGQQHNILTTSSSIVPPGNTATTSQSPIPNQMTQAQAAVAMKMPLQGGARPLVAGSNVQIPASSTMVVPPSTATAVPTPTAAEASAKKKKDEEERRAERNAANRARRAHLKKKKEEEQQKLLMGKGPSGNANVNGSPSLIAPADPLAGASLLSSTPIATTTPSTIGGSSVSTTASTGSKKVKDFHKTKKIVKKSPSFSSVNSAKKKAIPYVKEYEDHMEWLDHAVLIDPKTLPNLISKEYLSDIHLHEEQRNLLYGDKSQRDKVKEITNAAERMLSSDTLGLKLKEAGVPPLPWRLPCMYDAWGEKNVVSTRMAWAKVRLPESEMKMKETKKELEENVRREQPMGTPSSSVEVDRTSDLLPKSSSPLTTGSVATQRSPPTSFEAPKNETGLKHSSLLEVEHDTTNHVWFNEARASQDPTLALLSEATELYLKSAIEKAICKARLRQNLDGIRLWNTLLTRASDSKNGAALPPAVIRLGCDVRRQVALAEGNAAKTYQRMEEAISRQSETYQSNSIDLDPETMILESTSMADLSKKPPLKSAVESSDIHAKRKFEIYGGKHSSEPPLGRVPKQAKVTLQDMAVGSLGNRESTNPARRKLMMASLFS